MAEGVTYFSTEEADTKYLNLFVISATSTLESGNYDNAPAPTALEHVLASKCRCFGTGAAHDRRWSVG